MSEIQVKTIKGLGTAGITIKNPVGFDDIAAPSNGFSVNGVVSVVNSGVQVVTVESENFGIKIKAPPQNSDSILRFTDNSGNDRAAIVASFEKELMFESQGVTGVVMNNQGLFETKYASQFRNNSTLAGQTQFSGQSSFSLTPKCSGTPILDEHLVNLNFLKLWYLFSPERVKLWSYFGNVENDGIAIPRVPSGKRAGKCCCGCGSFPGSRNPGVYETVLTGKWTIVAFGMGIRSCSCSDYEQFHFPIDDSAVWDLEDNSVYNTISGKINPVYNGFGFAIKQYPSL
jgi:hypothetical protein